MEHTCREGYRQCALAHVHFVLLWQPRMLADAHGRAFHYLRLSLTDVCNFKCAYCLPNGYEKHARAELSQDEIVRLVRAFVHLGVWKVRLTGGEPTTRGDLLDIVRAISGVRRLALSTNGHRLVELAGPLQQAGVHALNVSVDSLDREVFARITGRDRLVEVKAGVEAAVALGLTVKVNAVLLAGDNDGDDTLAAFAEWTRTLPIVVRYIELMQTQDNVVYFRRRHTSADRLRDRLLQDGWVRRARAEGDGPAEEYRRDGYAGGLGLIAAYSPGFCDTCNRLRVNARGQLRLCLFGDGAFDLRPWLQRDDQRDALAAEIRACLAGKTKGHRLHEDNPGDLVHLAAIGG